MRPLRPGNDPPCRQQCISEHHITGMDLFEQVGQEGLFPRPLTFAGADLIAQDGAAGHTNEGANPGQRKAQPTLLLSALRIRLLIARRIGQQLRYARIN